MIIFGSVIYCEGLKFFEEFLRSLADQSYRDFRLLLMNDGIAHAEIYRYLDLFLNLKNRTKIVDCQEGRSISNIRVDMIFEAKKMCASDKKNKKNYLVFGDSDDVFAHNRIMEISKLIHSKEYYAFYYNKLMLFDGSYIMEDIPEKTYSITQIGEKNHLGLSNTAIDLDWIKESYLDDLYNCDTNVFDWFFYSFVLLKGGQGKLVPNTYSKYRIYNSNIAGVRDITLDNLIQEVEIKRKHYNLLKKQSPYFEQLYFEYNNLNKEDMLKLCAQSDYWWGFVCLNGIG